MEEAEIEKYLEEIDSEMCAICEKKEFCKAYRDVICSPLAILRILLIQKERISLNDVREAFDQWKRELKKLKERYDIPDCD